MKLAKRSYILLGGVLLVALALAGAKLADRSETVTLPAGTTIQVSLAHAISSDQAKSGDDFEATVASPVIVDGKTAIPQGSEVQGRLVDARESGRLKGVARLRLALDEVEVNGDWYEVETTSVTRSGQNHNKRNWLMIGGGTAGGALIGGLAGGGKGAAIGAGVGAGAGTATAAYTGKKDIRLPAETVLSFRLTQPVSVKVKS